MTNAEFLQQIAPFIPQEFLLPRKEPLRPVIYPYVPGYVPQETKKPSQPDKTGFITGPQIRKVAINLSAERSETISKEISNIAPKYDLDHWNIFEELFANICHETGGFRTYSENLNYSAQGMANTWPSRYAKRDAKGNVIKPYTPNDKAVIMARNPEMIANDTYGGRNGNTKPGDGWMFRGGGGLMLTGRFIYEAYSGYCAMSVEKVADLVRSSDDYAIDSACWCFSIHMSLTDLAKRDAFDAICKRINGGVIGYSDRLDYLHRIKSVFG